MKRPKISLAEADKIALRCTSYSRLPTVIGLVHDMEYEEWLAVLGDNWSICDNISEHLRWLRYLLPQAGPVDAMMTAEERAAWHALPERVTVYRGARQTHLGASWTLDRATAERFPFLGRYTLGGPPVLLTAEVRRRNVLALKLDRDEAEAIVLRGRRILSREPIPAPPPPA